MWTLAEIKSEIKATCSFGVLAIITTLGDFLMLSTTLSFMGHLDSDSLAAASLALSWAVSTFFAVWGLSSTLVTYVAQAKGANNPKLVGHSLQRALLVMVLACIPVGCLWIFTAPIFRAVGIEEKTANKAGEFNVIQLPGILPYGIYVGLVKYVQAQGEYRYPAIASSISCLCNVVFNYFFMFGFFGVFGFKGLGYVGAPIAFALTKFVYLGLMLLILKYKLPYHKQAWTGWSCEAFQPYLILEFLKIGIPTAFTICLEVWAFDAITLVAGMLKNSNFVSAHAIGFNLVFFAYLCPGGIGDAAATRVGIALGGGNFKDARQTALIAIGFICTITTTTGILLLSLHNFIPYIYTNDPDVIRITSKIILFVGVIALVDGIQSACGAILRGCGRPKPGTFCNLIGHYLFGIPIGCSLAFATKLKIYGLWCGMVCGTVVVCVSLVTILVRLDWSQVAAEAKQRTRLETELDELDDFVILGDEDIKTNGKPKLEQNAVEGEKILGNSDFAISNEPPDSENEKLLLAEDGAG
eukprot:Phypoly_transcript_04644.p1 GENE.Phypoly_transcript_04644~~Phypoly_transcript_04644.p1  ORF type:complete len:526 (+),score=52.34 Phypoly_transcript_04644:540-2117(+)